MIRRLVEQGAGPRAESPRARWFRCRAPAAPGCLREIRDAAERQQPRCVPRRDVPPRRLGEGAVDAGPLGTFIGWQGAESRQRLVRMQPPDGRLPVRVGRDGSRGAEVWRGRIGGSRRSHQRGRNQQEVWTQRAMALVPRLSRGGGWRAHDASVRCEHADGGPGSSSRLCRPALTCRPARRRGRTAFQMEARVTFTLRVQAIVVTYVLLKFIRSLPLKVPHRRAATPRVPLNPT